MKATVKTTVKAITITTFADDAAIEREIIAVTKAGETFQLRMQKLLIGIAAMWAGRAQEDARPTLKQVNSLISTLPKGIRANGIKAWVEIHLGFKYLQEGDAKGGFAIGTKQGKDIDLRTAANSHWFLLSPEPEYKPLDLDAAVASLLAKIEKELRDHPANALDMAKVSALRGMVKTTTKAGKAPAKALAKAA